MPTKTFSSRHIHLSDEDSKTLIQDIECFNQLVRKATQMIKLEQSKTSAPIDLRTREGKLYADTQSPSVFKQLKAMSGIKTYYVNSAINTAKGNIRSQQELKKDYIQQKKDAITKVKNKLSKTTKQYNNLLKVKKSLINYSKSQKYGSKSPKVVQSSTLRIDPESNVYQIRCFGKIKQSYSCMYDFELQYLDGKIKQLKRRKRNLENRLQHLTVVLEKLKNDDSWHICYGTKSYFRKQNTVLKDSHALWHTRWHKRRNRSMCISGRKDLPQGNPVCRYDVNNKILCYTTMGGTKIYIPCNFPYGQEEIENAILQKNGYDANAIAWCFERTHGSFLVKCILTVPKCVKNYCYSDGCIGVDTNYDNLSFTEVDGQGNLLHHEIISFDVEDISTQKTKNILSNKIEQIFQYAQEVNKPIVMENLKIKDRTSDYNQNKKKMKKISSFASQKVTELMFSKANKYGIEVKTVHPAYTSFIGNIKYKKHHGLSIHEAASYVIARRGMGYKEKIPKTVELILGSALNKQLDNWNQWKFIYKNRIYVL